MNISKKITIITCTLNSEKYLSACLESVISQSYKNIEHIFIDGGSTDNTLNIIKQYYPNGLVYPQSGKGLYDALNEGLKKARGDVIGFLHSDDIFFDNYCLERINKNFQNITDLDFFCSRMEVWTEDLKEKFAILGGAPHKPSWQELFYSSNYYAHPTYYVSTKKITELGLFNTSYKFAADIDWLKRLEKISQKYIFDPLPLIKFRTGGISSRHYFLGLKEEFIIALKSDGFNSKIVITYAYHFLRRGVRFILEKIKLFFLIKSARTFLNKFTK